ncbi:ABC transporter [Mycolicibacterium duvalii]|uniref:ABC transporter ATP-binding protein n=1 Tax=Mycolicibacterium duvalii TaxID=39688 RepID=A0A7I7K5Y5_9MYCO|nr:ATP-binding cassette domain-containing protein [Mycolicibacterium duvalii]MCV7367500.1 ATP-binding cassette domain-containing protein [Mycolicibacterium duvalii]PEG44170.1 ABC transporter [Mycolicibacterium duvalii]BBX18909.1 ABC transporter ATP-binding protein [Mycolicibacterium duvalii]
MTGIRAAGVSVTLAGRTVLDGVDLVAPAGAVTGVTGASGSGKTTLLRVLAGLRAPDAGEVRYDGGPVPPSGSIALLAQHPRQVCNPRWTLAQIIAEPAAIRGASSASAARQTLDEVALRVGLEPELLDRYPGQVSDGQLQRACLGRAMLAQARFVLCDEPTAMLDPIATGSVVSVLRDFAAAGAAVVLVSHDPGLVETLADEVLALPRPLGLRT